MKIELTSSFQVMQPSRLHAFHEHRITTPLYPLVTTECPKVFLISPTHTVIVAQ